MNTSTWFFVVHMVLGALLASSGVIMALTLGFTSLPAVLGAAAIGFVVAMPVAWILIRRVL